MRVHREISRNPLNRFVTGYLSLLEGETDLEPLYYNTTIPVNVKYPLVQPSACKHPSPFILGKGMCERQRDLLHSVPTKVQIKRSPTLDWASHKYQQRYTYILSYICAGCNIRQREWAGISVSCPLILVQLS